jgi:predicted nucleic acid-binding protein
VSKAWVVNASPLILFSRFGRLDLIERLAPRVLIPNAVIDEVSKQKGLIASVRPLVSELVAAGIFLDDQFVDRALACVGE